MKENEATVQGAEVASSGATGNTGAGSIDTKMVEALRTEVDAFAASLKDKVYPVKVTTALMDVYIDFFETQAEWKGMEALGIIEVSAQLKEARTQPLTDGNMFIKNLAIQAMSYFINNVSGSRLDKAERFLSMIRPVNDAMRMIKADTDQLNAMNMNLSAAEHGIEVDNSKEASTEEPTATA